MGKGTVGTGRGSKKGKGSSKGGKEWGKKKEGEKVGKEQWRIVRFVVDWLYNKSTSNQTSGLRAIPNFNDDPRPLDGRSLH